MNNSGLDLQSEVKVLLLTKNTANRTALESMLSFGSQQISVVHSNSIKNGEKELKTSRYDALIICHSILEEEDTVSFLKKNSSIPVVIIDNYYNKARSDQLFKAGALDYLDISTLDSRLLIKSINFSIQQHNTKVSARKTQRNMEIRSSFLTNISHEIRTPLNSIIGFSELLFEDETDPVKKEKLNMIRQSGKHLLTLINSILDFSKLEAGKIKIEKKEFSLDNLIQTLYYMMLVKSGNKNIDLNIKPHGTIPEMVIGDEFRLNQVLINLMNNAIKFTDSGSVTLEYSYSNGKACFNIIDTGIGIPASKIEHIFNAFEQVNSSLLTNEHSGTGLGLAISKSLVQLMKGSISVRSEVNLGSTFSICIPLEVTRWQSEISQNKNINKFPTRKLGIVILSEESKEIINDWAVKAGFSTEYLRADFAEIKNDFLDSDLFLLPQESYKNQFGKLTRILQNKSRTIFKPKILYFNRNNKLYFLIDKSAFKTQLIDLPAKLLDKNYASEEFINIINRVFETIEQLGKKLLSKWKKSFELENPDLEEVLNEALQRFGVRQKELNAALDNSDYKQIENIAHSLKGFTGQTCMYEVSSRASILLNEMRKKDNPPHPNVIQREIAALNEIIWLMPRKFLGYQPPVTENTYPSEIFPPLRILAAEDDPINQAVLKDFLRHHQLECDLASNGREALKMLQNKEYDIVFLDLQMPVMSGKELLENIHDNDKWHALYTVVISGFTPQDKEIEKIKHLCSDFLTKPFSKKDISKVLKKAAAARKIKE